MKLYELPRSKEGIPLYGLKPDNFPKGIVKFYHIDGMYSYCEAFDDNGKLLGPVHLSASTPIKPYKDGYVVDD